MTLARQPLDGDPADWSIVTSITLVCILPSGEPALRPDGHLPSDTLAAGEHPLDACLRIPLEQAGFRYQHFHPFAIDGGHLYGWVEGDRYHTTFVEPRVGLPDDESDVALVVEALADHAALPAEVFFRENVRTLERAYLLSANPRGQSGFGGDEAAWRARRMQIADCVDRNGTFLDVGCANGYLAESIVRWCAERELHVEPFGVDLAPRLIDLARRRLPQWADRFWVGNALDWIHPQRLRFDFVHILLDVVPSGLESDLVRHHLKATVADGGRLLVSHYSAVAGARMDRVLVDLGFRAGGWMPSRDPTRPSAGTAWIDK